MMNNLSKSTMSPVKESSPKKQVEVEEKWEVRPCGMLVQKRDPDSGLGSPARVPTIRVKVKYAGVYHEVYISSQATFGEVKKLVSAKTGLHPDDQKILFKDRERDSKAFLDTAGVKDRSKLTLLDDPEARARRLLELRRTEKADKASKSISRVSLEVDRLATKVSALETIVNKGQKVVESDVIRLTELLMNELLKLDAIVAEGDIKEKRKFQVKRVQKFVELLDAIKAKNSRPTSNSQTNQQQPQPKSQPLNHQYSKDSNMPPKPQSRRTTDSSLRPKPQTQYSNGLHLPPKSEPENDNVSHLPLKMPPKYYNGSHLQSKAQQQHNNDSHTQPPPPWEQYDLLSSMPSTSSATSTTTMASMPTPRYDWELF
ncbi:hypothetical protein LUZ63_009417 [Rhynchospora breviuscula]|uniref:BAG family molecular chaperone regulator 1 n=1 Tax=Rhynchospora breviuscula TaxID=2022672 RepID=A0A9Q0CFV2_9POAL|nr:hypothetical protein LUZ63_009417 [Rhynchospora breviuscula]